MFTQKETNFLLDVLKKISFYDISMVIINTAETHISHSMDILLCVYSKCIFFAIRSFRFYSINSKVQKGHVQDNPLFKNMRMF
jgi:hypothetical protein